MPKAITKKQLDDFFFAEFIRKNMCMLCGQTGIIDTRGRMFTPAGVECGGIAFCICPNGRAIKKQDPRYLERK